MRHRKTGPIENLLRDPRFLAGIAYGCPTGRTLRQIDDPGNTRFLRRLREIDCVCRKRRVGRNVFVREKMRR